MPLGAPRLVPAIDDAGQQTELVFLTAGDLRAVGLGDGDVDPSIGLDDRRCQIVFAATEATRGRLKGQHAVEVQIEAPDVDTALTQLSGRGAMPGSFESIDDGPAARIDGVLELGRNPPTRAFGDQDARLGRDLMDHEGHGSHDPSVSNDTGTRWLSGHYVGF